jgi:HSP20 family molecular chaperone IbpA
MTRPLLSSPLLLGFDEIERLIDRVGKAGGDGYPPYNIERILDAGQIASATDTQPRVELLRITLAVAGFLRNQIEITLEDNQLIVRGRQEDDKSRNYIHRGIAARQFSRTFVLADGIEVKSADLAHGLLAIDLARHEPEKVVRRIAIGTGEQSQANLSRSGPDLGQVQRSRNHVPK